MQHSHAHSNTHNPVQTRLATEGHTAQVLGQKMFVFGGLESQNHSNKLMVRICLHNVEELSESRKPTHSHTGALWTDHSPGTRPEHQKMEPLQPYKRPGPYYTHSRTCTQMHKHKRKHTNNQSHQHPPTNAHPLNHYYLHTHNVLSPSARSLDRDASTRRARGVMSCSFTEEKASLSNPMI